MNSRGLPDSGFTLIELVVVVSIIGLTLFFALPRFDAYKASSTSDSLTRLARLIQDLRHRSVRLNQDAVMNIDMLEGIIWISDDTMGPDEAEQAKEAGFHLAESLKITGVDVPNSGIKIENPVKIRFSRQGYSDMARIFLREGTTELTFVIEPFLAELVILEGHRSFENCR